MQKLSIKDIDWNLLWQEAKKKKSWKSKGVEDWNKKASSFARRTARSVYTKKFLDLLQPRKTWSVLDVGCGPGTLALPLAGLVNRVSALDFSPNMLKILRQQARKQKITNISTHELSWDDDWLKNGIAVHDVAIASRSLAVKNLRPALLRLTRHARHAVIITDLVGHGPFDPEAFRAVGRKLQTGPDYIYTVNVLYQMGFQACVDFIRIDESRQYASFEEAMDRFIWMFRDITGREQQLLEEYVRSIIVTGDDGMISLAPSHVPTWAFIRWAPRS